jgi:transcriptional regulator
MYSPSYNQVGDRAELLELMRANNFALLVTATGGVPAASHLPCIVEERGAQLALVMHMARANSQWQQFFDDEVLVAFSGPHAYVSPRWYEQVERVPTWNYAAVHAYGRVKVIEERAAKHAAVAKLVAAHDPQWRPTFESLRDEYVDTMLEAIVAFEIEVTRLEARWKLSQNRGRREQERIAAELEKSGDEVERALAALTRRHLVRE